MGRRHLDQARGLRYPNHPSPAALERPWIYFEAGAGWRRVHQIPLCHSGQGNRIAPNPIEPAASRKDDPPEYLKSVVKRIADIAENRVPTVDYEALAEELGAIETSYVSEGIAVATAEEPLIARLLARNFVTSATTENASRFASTDGSCAGTRSGRVA